MTCSMNLPDDKGHLDELSICLYTSNAFWRSVSDDNGVPNFDLDVYFEVDVADLDDFDLELVVIEDEIVDLLSFS